MIGWIAVCVATVVFFTVLFCLAAFTSEQLRPRNKTDDYCSAVDVELDREHETRIWRRPAGGWWGE